MRAPKAARGHVNAATSPIRYVSEYPAIDRTPRQSPFKVLAAAVNKTKKGTLSLFFFYLLLLSFPPLRVVTLAFEFYVLIVMIFIFIRFVFLGLRHAGSDVISSEFQGYCFWRVFGENCLRSRFYIWKDAQDFPPSHLIVDFLFSYKRIGFRNGTDVFKRSRALSV